MTTTAYAAPPFQLQPTGPSLDSMLASWSTYMRVQGHSSRTIECRRWLVRRAVTATEQPAERMTPEAVTYWLAGFTNSKTRATYFDGVASFYRWLEVAGYEHSNPMPRVPRPRSPRGLPRPCSDRALTAILALPGLPADTRAMVSLGAYAGLRIHEIAKFSGDQVDADAGTLRVLGKGCRDSVLPLHRDLAELALVMPASFWFPSPIRRGEPLGRGAAWAHITRAADLAGVVLTPHQLRHWFGTSLVRQGVDLRRVQILMRHSSLATTQGYIEIADAELLVAVLRLPTLGGGS